MLRDATYAFEGFVLVYVVLGCLAAYAIWKSRRKALARRTQRPIPARVVGSRWRQQVLAEGYEVVTRFEMAGRAVTHKRVFATESGAREFAGKYVMGTSHQVIPSLDGGAAFVPEDFERHASATRKPSPMDWFMAAAVVLATAGVFAAVISEQ